MDEEPNEQKITFVGGNIPIILIVIPSAIFALINYALLPTTLDLLHLTYLALLAAVAFGIVALFAHKADNLLGYYLGFKEAVIEFETIRKN